MIAQRDVRAIMERDIRCDDLGIGVLAQVLRTAFVGDEYRAFILENLAAARVIPVGMGIGDVAHRQVRVFANLCAKNCSRLRIQRVGRDHALVGHDKNIAVKRVAETVNALCYLHGLPELHWAARKQRRHVRRSGRYSEQQQ